MNKLVTMMDYEALRAEKTALRAKIFHRGIGIASFIEVYEYERRRLMALVV